MNLGFIWALGTCLENILGDLRGTDIDAGMLESGTKLLQQIVSFTTDGIRREHKFRSDVKYLSDRFSKKQVKLQKVCSGYYYIVVLIDKKYV